MYLIVIAWLYVVLMMSVAEATNSNGTVLGAIMTFLLYGAGPIALVAYLLGAPARSKAIKRRNEVALAAHRAEAASDPPDASQPTPSLDPDAGRHASGGAAADSIPTVRKEP